MCVCVFFFPLVYFLVPRGRLTWLTVYVGFWAHVKIASHCLQNELTAFVRCLAADRRCSFHALDANVDDSEADFLQLLFTNKVA